MDYITYNQTRLRDLNQKPIQIEGDYVLYWMQAYRRLEYNHSLNYSILESNRLNKPLVIYEGLRSDYPWASKRIHKFILEGFLDNKVIADKLGYNYWPYVEGFEEKQKLDFLEIIQKAALIITDDFPAFIIPLQSEKVAKIASCKFISVDGNSIIPLVKYGEFSSAARILRIRLHNLFSDAYHFKTNDLLEIRLSNTKKIKPPFKVFNCKENDIKKVLDIISFKESISPYSPIRGGRNEALKKLDFFIENNLLKYGEGRSLPQSPKDNPSSQLSPYLHFGFISAEEIIERVLNFNSKQIWAPDLLDFSCKGKREGFFHKNNSINSFLDELIVWRDIGFHTFYLKPSFRKNLSILPKWAKENQMKHVQDKRDYIYSKEQLELARTHDPIWNAAQIELVQTGMMHNYMRMLWAKKVIEWTPNYSVAFAILEDFNNKYAYDGRDPNSYTGILWSFGLFDRPWFPERNVFGVVRYMSSDSTKKKFKLDNYLKYINQLKNKEGNLFG
jgi:deoxyribodipyrimidine photo-lyase